MQQDLKNSAGKDQVLNEEKEYLLTDYSELSFIKEIEKHYDLKIRTKEFAHRCVKLAVSLPGNQLGNHIRGQMIRASTSVAANYRASQVAHSKKGFVAKLSIVIEECDECAFWIEFAGDEELITISRISALLEEARELTSIFITARKTAQTGEK